MSDIDTDYLWLSQRPRPRKRLRRFVLLILCLPLIAGAAWLYSTPEPQPPAGPSLAQAQTLPTQTTTSFLLSPQPPSSATPTAAPAATPQPQPVAQRQPQAPAAKTLQTALRLEPGRLLAPSHNLTYERGDEPSTTVAAASPQWIDIHIRKGDTLSAAFARHDLAYADSLAIAHLPDYGKYFTRGLRAGDTFSVKANAHGHVLALKHPLGPARYLQIQAGPDGYTAAIRQVDVNERIAYATGTINDSFYSDALDAGLTDRQIMALVDIFKWTVDFAYDIRRGDRFTVVYSELYKDGRKVANGHILAASFKAGDQLFRALRFTGYDNETVYYQPDGTSLKRAFIRTPVDYTRISSPFSMARNHPVLSTIRAHEGTDYAAPMGTPIHAAGSGRIKFRGRNGGYGNMIMIDHGSGISTRYGHMSRFASGLGVGSHVKQGQVIGYVGSTGLSTGPHLHYEFRVDGVPRNPETVDLPGAPPLPEEYMDDFKQHIQPLIAQLEAVSRTTLAQNSHTGFAQ